MPIEQIKKRNGAVVAFDRVKIEIAIAKAVAATQVHVPSDTISQITDEVVAETEATLVDESIPSVEDIQDRVERTIAKHGYFDVAKAYILYREHHKQAREMEQAKLIAKMKGHQLTVIKRDGTKAPFDVNEITRAISETVADLGAKIDVDEIVSETMRNLYDGIKTKDINRAVLMALRARIERDPVYSHVAARFLYNDVYKDVIGQTEFKDGFAENHAAGFTQSIERGVATGRLDQRLLEFDLPQLAKELDTTRDRLFRYLGAQTLYDRYFMRDYDQNIMETPQYFWMRVAMGLSIEEENRTERAKEFYHTMSRLEYVPSTPTLFHAGTNHPQMSSCYLTTVEDDLDHIFKSIGDNARLSKWSGGIANDWSNIRATGSLIKSTNVGSQGVVPFLKIVDVTTAAINRSGKRRGATCVYLETWHYDIEDFLELRKNTGDDRRRTHDTNTANWIPDLFMKRLINGQEWTLFSPDETPDLHHLYGKKFEERYEEYERLAAEGKIKLFKKMPAKNLWRKMITMLYETGHPWVTFKDPSNIRSPQDHVGVVHSSNLCTEITLNTSAAETAVCNLGSINLPRHITAGEIDKQRLEQTVAIAMRMLDNVIDLNYYPTPEAKHSNLKHRPVGLGIMGLQDALYQLNLSFDSEAAVQLSDETMEFMAYHAIMNSSKLAKERGAYQTFKGSKWDRGLLPLDTLDLLEQERGLPIDVNRTARLDWDVVRAHIAEHGMRNSNCMAIAPTATIANISGSLPSVEPIYKNIYVKSNFSGEFTVINDDLVTDLKAHGLWTPAMLATLKHFDGSVQQIEEVPADLRSKYKEVFEIDPIWIVRHAAVRGKWIDQSQSINIFTNSTSGRAVADTYIVAWHMGLKTTYYLRSLGASGIEKSTLEMTTKQEQSAPATAPAIAVATAAPAPTLAPSPVREHASTVAVPAALRAAIKSGTLRATAKHVHIAEEAICEACE
ncbi:MAG TPA: ribonucleoside-diphosphate reductase subunit alpha [Candidatus Andersenbacteria bacterium]|nr:ribonucleoside-diphosphate reductase subunit alpha [Candidatus Andersenbacteria bacterium]